MPCFIVITSPFRFRLVKGPGVLGGPTQFPKAPFFSDNRRHDCCSDAYLRTVSCHTRVSRCRASRLSLHGIWAGTPARHRHRLWRAFRMASMARKPALPASEATPSLQSGGRAPSLPAARGSSGSLTAILRRQLDRDSIGQGLHRRETARGSPTLWGVSLTEFKEVPVVRIQFLINMHRHG